MGLTIEQGEICIPGIYVVKPINCECLTKDQKPAERGTAEDRNSGRTAILASLEPLDSQDFDLWFSISSSKLLTVSAMSEMGELSYSKAILEASTSFSRFPLIPVRGVPLMSHIAQNWDPIWAFCPDPSDLLIATYPKAGTDSCSLCSCTVNVFCVTCVFENSVSIHTGTCTLLEYLHFLVLYMIYQRKTLSCIQNMLWILPNSIIK